MLHKKKQVEANILRKRLNLEKMSQTSNISETHALIQVRIKGRITRKSSLWKHRLVICFIHYSKKPKETLLLYHFWIEDLPSEEKLPPLTRTENQKLLTYGRSTLDSLPKLGLKFFCGDSLYLSCWSPLCKSVVHDTHLTLQEKIRDILVKKLSLQFKAIWLHWGFLLESTAGKNWDFNVANLFLLKKSHCTA